MTEQPVWNSMGPSQRAILEHLTGCTDATVFDLLPYSHANQAKPLQVQQTIIGGVLRTMASRGWVERTGTTRYGTRRPGHGLQPYQVWRITPAGRTALTAPPPLTRQQQRDQAAARRDQALAAARDAGAGPGLPRARKLAVAATLRQAGCRDTQIADLLGMSSSTIADWLTPPSPCGGCGRTLRLHRQGKCWICWTSAQAMTAHPELGHGAELYAAGCHCPVCRAAWKTDPPVRQRHSIDVRGCPFDRANQERAGKGRISAASISAALTALQAAGTPITDEQRETAQLRLQHPHDSATQLAARLAQPCTKDMVTGRLRRLVTAAALLPPRMATG